MSFETIDQWPVPSYLNIEGQVQLNRHHSFNDYPEDIYQKWNMDPAIENLKEVTNVVLYVGNLKLGDYVMLNPFLNSLRKAFPSSHIELMGNPVPPARALITGDKLVDSIFDVKRMKHRPWSLPEYIRWGKLKRKMGKIDLLIDTQRQFLPSVALKTVLSPEKNIGYSSGSFFSDWKIDESGRNKVHATFQIAVILKRLGIPLVYPLHILSVPIAIQDRVNAFFQKNEMDRTIALFPFTAEMNDCRSWPREHFIKLGEVLVNNGYSIILMGATSEIEELKKMRDKIGGRSFLIDWTQFELSEKDSIFLSMACLKKCVLSFSCMSGGGHLAAALGVRTLVFAPFERLDKFAPLGPNVWSLFCNIPCSPCVVKGKLACKGDRWCVHSISPDIVKNAIDQCVSSPEKMSLVNDRSVVRAC